MQTRNSVATSALSSAGPSLEKRHPDPEGLDFEGLRKAGIEQLQNLCGDIWSDYNLHDPGVTLLEQLCYGLTDLVYRSRFEPEDYLIGEDGQIDGARHALLPPEEVLPCGPLTPFDYRKIFADALPAIRNVWIVPAADGVLPGLVDIHLQLADDIEEGSAKAHALVDQAADLYHRYRNLCEDLNEVLLIGHMPYRLVGEVEIDDGRSPSEILADIYFACSTAISPPIPQRPYGDIADGELDRLFEGPLTRHGHIDSDNMHHWGGPTLSELIQAISSVDGVNRVSRLALLDDKDRPCSAATGDAATKRMPQLLAPRPPQEQTIKLRKAGRILRVTDAEFLDRFDRFVFAAESRRHSRSEHTPVSPLPTGEPVSFGQYHSVQHHLPPVYGLGSYGLPASATAERKGEARQLQAYLLLFEQLMLDYQQGLAELPRLFSTDETLDRSYFHRILDESDLPGIEQLYLKEDEERRLKEDIESVLKEDIVVSALKERAFKKAKERADAALGKLLARLDDFSDRRQRALDCLLAMHGEEFDQRIERNFIAESGRRTDTKLIHAKIAFLRRAPHLNGRRMAACDHRQATGAENISALAERVGLLLDLPVQHGTSVTDTVRSRGYRHLNNEEFLRQAGLRLATSMEGAEQVPPLGSLPLYKGESILTKQLLCPALMNRGSSLGRYRILSDGPNSASFSLYFNMGRKMGHCRLSGHANKREAVIEANRLSRFFDTLVAETAGFHLVEHLLLRAAGDLHEPAATSFHAFRMSAVFPAWSPRFSNPEFRKLAERTLSRCSPAHIAIEVLWLDFEEMATFEHLHSEWQRLKRELAHDSTVLERSARALALFLEQHAPKPGDHIHWI